MFRQSIIRCLHNTALKPWLKPTLNITSIHQLRHLYSKQQLGIDKYESVRELTVNSIRDHQLFREDFENRLENSVYDIERLELDLKKYLHLMTHEETDIHLLKKALNMLVEQQESSRDKIYSYDAVILRMFHFLHMPHEALQCFEDQVIGKLFSSWTGYQLLLDLLYEGRKFEDLLRIYNQLSDDGRIDGHKYIDSIIFATFYQLNTNEAYVKSLEKWHSLSNGQLRASRIFAAALAVKQNDPKTALELMKGESMYSEMINISLMAYAQTGQIKQIFTMLYDLIQNFKETPNKHKIPFDVVSVIKKAVEQAGLPDDQTAFCQICDEMKKLQMVTNRSFDDRISGQFKRRQHRNNDQNESEINEKPGRLY